MTSYIEYMNKLSKTDLQKYLGDDVVDLLVEWFPSGDNLLTKKKLITMIDSLRGASILENKDFRRDLLGAMTKQDVYAIRDNCLPVKDRKEADPNKLIDIIISKPWGKNTLTRYLLNAWEVPETVLDKPKDDTVTENSISASPEQFYELLDYQYYIKQRVLNLLNSDIQLELLLIHMPTGTGKTKTTMHIITSYINFTTEKQGLVIWIAHTNELLQQAYDTFTSVWSHLGNGEINAYKIWGNASLPDTNSQLNGIAFCGLAKLMSIYDSDPATFERLKRDCRLIVFDEAHKAAATKTKKVVESLMRMPEGYENRALIGLTATPGRTTMTSFENNLLSNMFGNKLIYIDSDIINQMNLGQLEALNTEAETNIIKYFQERRILAKMNLKRLTYKNQFSEKDLKVLSKSISDMGLDGSDYTSDQLRILASNKERNLAILTQIRQLHIDKVPTIVFACSVNHAKLLSAMLNLEGIKNSLVVGDLNTAERKKAIDDFKDKNSGVDVIINYEVLTTGFDSKNIKCVLIARPTKSIVLYSQMLGRGLRGPLMGGNEECLLVDIDDNIKAFDNEKAFSHFDAYWRTKEN